MSIGLHEIISGIESGRAGMPHWADSRYLSYMSNAMCFDAGLMEAYGDGFGKIIHAICRLPYKSNWFEFTDHFGVRFGVFARQFDDGEEIWFLFFKDKFAGWIYMDSAAINREGEKVRVKTEGKGTDRVKLVVDVLISFVLAFLSALNCNNVHRREHVPDQKLQKARQKRGNLPLFSYWTLELKAASGDSSESGGGTHSSPRLHLRRGHARQYAPGLYTWVQPCVVGNKRLGMVHKDYALA